MEKEKNFKEPILPKNQKKEIKEIPSKIEKTETIKEQRPKFALLTIEEFARKIGLQPDSQGRFTFGPEHIQMAYEYAEEFVSQKHAGRVLIDGIASPGVIAALLHGIHPAEGYLTYVHKDVLGKTTITEVKILEPIPQGKGKGPEGFIWRTKENPQYTLVEFSFAGNFNVEDLEKVIPPEVNPSKPVIISGRGPVYLTQTIAAAYRHYKGLPGVGFYQPASKFGPSRTEIGISHSKDLPLGLSFGEPSEIGLAKKLYERRIQQNLKELKKIIEEKRIASVDIEEKKIRITLDNGESYSIYIRDVIKNQ